MESAAFRRRRGDREDDYTPAYGFRRSVVSGVPARGRGYHGVVQFGGGRFSGVVVSAASGDQKLTAITDQQGAYSFPDLHDGTWTVEVDMSGFAPIHQDVAITPDAAPGAWELEASAVCGDCEGRAGGVPPKIAVSMASAVPKPAGFQRADVNAKTQALPPPAVDADPEAAQKAANLSADGLLINGSQNNSASSPFSLDAAFGNNRRGPGSLYTGSLGFITDTSALDARAFSLTGQNTPKPGYEHLQGVATLGGPLRIPHLIRNGPVFFVGYQWMRNRNSATQTSLVPTAVAKGSSPGEPISPQAQALLKYYPMPNFAGNSAYNYQVPLTNFLDQNALQLRLSKNIGQRDQLFGSFALQRAATSSTNLFGFLDTGETLGWNSAANWTHRIGARFFVHLEYQYSRQSSRATPYFANRENVSGDAGNRGQCAGPGELGPADSVFSRAASQA